MLVSGYDTDCIGEIAPLGPWASVVPDDGLTIMVRWVFLGYVMSGLFRLDTGMLHNGLGEWSIYCPGPWRNHGID